MEEKEKDIGACSDGYHTFDELYEHRNTLFLNLMNLKGHGQARFMRMTVIRRMVFGGDRIAIWSRIICRFLSYLLWKR